MKNEKEYAEQGATMNPVLYINCCVRKESRTNRLALEVLKRMGGEYTELYLPGEPLLPLSEERLEKRTRLLEEGRFDDEMFHYARQFADAERIVIAAPFWDLSFPAVLKLYLENIYATGIVSEYDEQGRPHGLCRAKELVYVTTAGGPLVESFGYEYIKDLATDYFGIGEVSLVKAEMLDVVGMDAEKILEEAMRGI